VLQLRYRPVAKTGAGDWLAPVTIVGKAIYSPTKRGEYLRQLPESSRAAAQPVEVVVDELRELETDPHALEGSGNAAVTLSALLAKVDNVKHPGARIALVEAIDRPAPSGDLATADALVAADRRADDKVLMSVDNTAAQVAWRLRVRGQ
jgi:hypothetical protein